jgi:mannose-6-phosphate isomerase-like protein (cupin superfamily)
MRLLITATDADGKSYLAECQEIEAIPLAAAPTTAVAQLFATTVSPPPAAAPAVGEAIPDRVGPGLVQWYSVEHAPSPDGERPVIGLHHRNAIDLIVVLEGGGELGLHDGEHPVAAGDCIVMPGTDHTLRPGPQGCRLMSFAIGTPPPTSSN